MNDITQGNLSIADYFTKMKKCWDELHALNGLPECSCDKITECTCGILTKMQEIDERNQLMQFLMKLNDSYDSARTQILLMYPLPSVGKPIT